MQNPAQPGSDLPSGRSATSSSQRRWDEEDSPFIADICGGQNLFFRFRGLDVCRMLGHSGPLWCFRAQSAIFAFLRMCVWKPSSPAAEISPPQKQFLTWTSPQNKDPPPQTPPPPKKKDRTTGPGFPSHHHLPGKCLYFLDWYVDLHKGWTHKHTIPYNSRVPCFPRRLIAKRESG